MRDSTVIASVSSFLQACAFLLPIALFWQADKGVYMLLWIFHFGSAERNKSALPVLQSKPEVETSHKGETPQPRCRWSCSQWCSSSVESACAQPPWRPSVLPRAPPAASSLESQQRTCLECWAGTKHPFQAQEAVPLSSHALTHAGKPPAAASITPWLTGKPALLSPPALPARLFIICSAACGTIISGESPGGLHLQTPLSAHQSHRTQLTAGSWPEFTSPACRE